MAARFRGAPLTLVTSTIIPHEKNDRPGRECPCCGSTNAWGLGRVDDLSVLINRHNGRRTNRWDQSVADGTLKTYDSLAAQATEWGGPSNVWHAPIVYRCTEKQVEALTDDTSEVVLFTGGWRSGKTYLGDSWWTRGWLRYGGRGEIFWLVSPSLLQSFKNMRKIFFGKASDAPLLPAHEGVPMLAHSFPDKHTSAHMHFPMLDGSIIELRHAGTGGAGRLEGDDVRRIHIDEAARIRDPEAYQVCRSRVAQSMGAVGMSTVPDDDGGWIYDEIVAPCEQGTGKRMRLVTISSYDNPFLHPDAIARLEAGTTDPRTIEEKIHGRWTRGGAYAYGDVWGEALQIDTASIDPAAWGFRDDCTRMATRALWGPDGVDFIGGCDSNWSPQTVVVGKVFGEIDHPSTWVFCAVDELTLDGDSEMAAKALAHLRGGRYKGRTGLIPDGNMFRDANHHGGHANQSNDAAEYKRLGFRVAPPIRVGGTRASNPAVLESRKLVRIMMRSHKLLVSSVTCPQLCYALSRVPNRDKAHSESGSYIDRRVYNMDDSLRYVCWRFFSKRLLPTAPPPSIGVAGRVDRTID